VEKNEKGSKENDIFEIAVGCDQVQVQLHPAAPQQAEARSESEMWRMWKGGAQPRQSNYPDSRTLNITTISSLF